MSLSSILSNIAKGMQLASPVLAIAFPQAAPVAAVFAKLSEKVFAGAATADIIKGPGTGAEKAQLLRDQWIKQIQPETISDLEKIFGKGDILDDQMAKQAVDHLIEASVCWMKAIQPPRKP